MSLPACSPDVIRDCTPGIASGLPSSRVEIPTSPSPERRGVWANAGSTRPTRPISLSHLWERARERAALQRPLRSRSAASRNIASVPLQPRQPSVIDTP